jgi:NAD+ synthase (glutamine-hydrolysing)
MKLINVAAVALNQTPLDWPGNARNIRNAIEAARAQGASIVCLPELAITGYGCEDAFLSADVQQRAMQVLRDLVPHTNGVIVSVGLPLLHCGAFYNCVCLIANQQLLGFVAKSRLAGDGIHYEPRWFKEWPSGHVGEVEVDGKDYPIGSLVFDLGGVRIGFEICEDAWAASRPGSELSQAAADLILNPSASHFAFGKQEVRRRLVLESSRAFGVTYVYANLLGNEAGRVIYDGATLVASSGRMVAEGKRLSFSDYVVTTASVDVDTTRMNRARLASFRPGDGELGFRCVKATFRFPDVEPQRSELSIAAWESGEHVKEEEFSRAVSLGLFDYLRKSRSNGFVVSLSGGADSSAVATLVWLAVRFGIQDLGREEFVAKLSHIASVQDAVDPDAIVGRLLTCVYQATRNSSQTTEQAAATLATALGAEYLRLDVDPMVESYVEEVSKHLGRKLNWTDDDIALQNIQARVRAPGVWLIANLRNALLLATSNRSEAAVGYATMDGDTCGGLSPIAGIDKAFLREWLDWMSRIGPKDVGSLPALTHVTCQEPTAELRPQEASQTDEGDLMPYELLDWIERAAIRDKHGPIDVFRITRAEFPGYTARQLAAWIERFFRLWARNQWKRERYAPSFHLDDENLDPKTWCRFPILSGGFEQELADMRGLLEAVER